ncbi:MAG TPA: lantibiotic dehydratase, partial [Kofleriaceae bacterium]|nr:lantibiotic dehydratase [Kofleriaceae bacterium]
MKVRGKQPGDPARAPAARAAPSGFFALRTPALPVDEYVAWGEGLTGDLDADVALQRARLRALVERPEVREALFVASPSVWDSLPHWLEDPDGERGQKVERSLVKYVARMATRSTPFGLFAAASVGRIGERTRLDLTGATARRHTRLDGNYLDALCRGLLADPAIRAGVTLRPNSSMYLAAGRWRLAESRLSGKERSYHLVAIEPDEYLAAVLERAAGGATIAELAAHLVERDPDIEPGEAEGYIEELITHQVLLPDLAPPVTGCEPLADIVAQLEAIPAGRPAAELLARTSGALAELDASGVGGDPARYRAVADQLASLPAEIELPRLFQVDLVRSTPEVTLSAALVDEIA